jgi:hypothetical protein
MGLSTSVETIDATDKEKPHVAGDLAPSPAPQTAAMHHKKKMRHFDAEKKGLQSHLLFFLSMEKTLKTRATQRKEAC